MKLIIPDVHNREKIVQPVIDKYDGEVDEIIFLGDILDNPEETDEDTKNTLYWFKEILKRPDVVWLYGNHENPYLFPSLDLMWNGRSRPQRGEMFRSILGEDRWKGKLCHWDGEWLYSHAGIHPTLFKDVPSLEIDCQRAILAAKDYCMHSLFTAGYGRGGPARYGGINWLDWDCEFDPIPGLNQIVGHTKYRIPRFEAGENSRNWCLDTNSAYYGITDGDMLIVRRSDNHEPFFPDDAAERQLIYEYLK